MLLASSGARLTYDSSGFYITTHLFQLGNVIVVLGVMPLMVQ
jgi:hypothetical protein